MAKHIHIYLPTRDDDIKRDPDGKFAGGGGSGGGGAAKPEPHPNNLSAGLTSTNKERAARAKMAERQARLNGDHKEADRYKAMAKKYQDLVDAGTNF